MVFGSGRGGYKNEASLAHCIAQALGATLVEGGLAQVHKQCRCEEEQVRQVGRGRRLVVGGVVEVAVVRKIGFSEGGLDDPGHLAHTCLFQVFLMNMLSNATSF